MVKPCYWRNYTLRLLYIGRSISNWPGSFQLLDAGKPSAGCWGRKEHQHLTQGWAIYAATPTCHTNCAYWCSSGVMVVRVTTCFLTGLESYFRGIIHVWYCKCGQTLLTEEIIGHREKSTDVLINGTLSSYFLNRDLCCSEPWSENLIFSTGSG